MGSPSNRSDNGDVAAWWSWIGIRLTIGLTFEEVLFIFV